MNLKQFGGGLKVYQFPPQCKLSTNFLDSVTQTQRLPGTDGGYDAYGIGRLPSEVGTLAAEWWLFADPAHSISALKHALAQTATWGRRPLWADAEEYPDRWCSVKLDNLQAPINNRDRAYKQQLVKANFQASHPRWHSRPDRNYLGESLLGGTPLVDAPTHYYDYDAVLGISQTLSIPRCTAYVSDGTRLDLLNMGDAPAQAKLTIMPSRSWTLSDGLNFGDPGVMVGAYGSVSLERPGVKRLNDYGDVVEHWRWDNTLTLNEQLIVNTPDYSVKWMHYPSFNETGYSDFQAVAGAGFITLQPGSNILEVEGTFDGPFGFLIVDFDDTWY